jgi:hypothetical protein
MRFFISCFTFDCWVFIVMFSTSTNKLIFVCEMKQSGQLEIPRDAITKQVNSGDKES